jgi:hypothetical protein
LDGRCHQPAIQAKRYPSRDLSLFSSIPGRTSKYLDVASGTVETPPRWHQPHFVLNTNHSFHVALRLQAHSITKTPKHDTLLR